MNNAELTKKVWESIKGSASKAKKFEDLVAVSISLISENVEDMYVAVKNGQLSVEPYRYNDNNCTIEASAETVEKLFAGEISFDKALSDGSVQIKSGDVAKFKALECLVPKKSAAKPAAKEAAKPAVKEPAKPAAKEADKTAAKPAAAPKTNNAKKTKKK